MDESGWGITGRRLTRGALLRGGTLAGAGLAAAALIGCGGDDDEGAQESPQGTATTSAGTGGGAGKLIKDPNLPYPFQFPEPNKTPKEGGTFTVGVSWDTSTWDTAKSAAGGTITVPNTSNERLLGFVSGVSMDPVKLELKDELAKSWERSPDGLVYTFKIQPGVKWHNVAPLNGRAFVAADAQFAYQRYQTLTESVHKSIHGEVDRFEAPDSSTLRIVMKKPLVDYVYNLAGRYQTIFAKELVDSGEIDKKVVGTGPMIFREAQASQFVNFERNPDYWRSKVRLAGMQYKIIPDIAARLAAFRAGQLDYGYSIASKLSEVKAVERTNPGVQVSMFGGTGGGYGFGMNLQNPKFKDERVRRAIALANDHETTVALLFENLGLALPDTPWTFHLDKAPNMQAGELGQWHKWKGDPATATQLLEAAGTKDLKIDATYYTYAAFDSQRAELLTDQFRKAGITLSARKVEYTEFNSQWVGGKLAEATTSGWTAGGFDADNYFYNQIHSKSPGNRHRLEDAQIDQWAEQQRTELNPAARRELHKKIYDRILDQAFRIPQGGPYYFEVQQPWLRGYRGGGALGTSSFYYDWGEQVHEIWIDK